MRRRVALSVLFALPLSGCLTHQYHSRPRIGLVGGDPIVQMEPSGRMPSVLQPILVTAEKHSDRPDDVDRVVGIVLGSEARAYPVGLLDRFEVVNDASPVLSYVVVRCALTGIAAAYDRRVGDLVLTFENSGALWRDTLVLQDRETKSYWSAATGRALWGNLVGEVLRPVPARVTTVENWERAYPESLYLDLDRSTIVPLPIRLYQASPAQGISGARTGDLRFRAKQEVFVVAQDGEAIAFGAEDVRAAGRIEATFASRQMAIEWDRALETPFAYEIGGDRREIAVVPMYWFAVTRHFSRVRLFPEPPTGSHASK